MTTTAPTVDVPATRSARREWRRELAAWMRANAVSPTGAAWDSALAGSRDVAALRLANAADGAAPKRLPDGAALPAYVRAGDVLTGHGVVVADAIADPETGATWVVVRSADGALVDVELPAGEPVDVVRKRVAPAWVQAAAADYRGARDAWEAARESGRPAPSSVPGAAGANVSMMQLEDADYRAHVPAPRFAEFLADHAARMREAS